MIRCAWCGAENLAIDMWCNRCQHHLDWAPARTRRSRARRALGFLAPAAAAIGVALALGLPAAGWFNGSLLAGSSTLPRTAASTPAPSIVAAASSAPGSTVEPAATPEASLAPSALPSDETTPAPVVPPAPSYQLPATVPLTQPRLQAAPISAGDPVAAINRFYDAVSAHQFGLAASLWSAQMKAQYPPDVYINQRFSATQRIGLTGDTVLSDGNGVAVVYVNVAEVIGGQNRNWVGTWQLVETPSGWLLNSADLQAA